MADPTRGAHVNPTQTYGYDFNTYLDERGRPYTWLGGKAGGQKVYISPVAYGLDKPGDDGGGFFRTDLGFNTQTGDWERDWDWQNIGTLAAGGLGAAAVAPAVIGAASGGGGAGGAGVSGAAGPGFAHQAVANTAAHFGGGGGMTGAASGMLGNAGTLKKIAGLGLGVGSGLMARANQPQMSPEVQQLLQEAIRRMMGQRELYDSVSRGLQAGLPTYAKKGPQ